MESNIIGVVAVMKTLWNLQLYLLLGKYATITRAPSKYHVVSQLSTLWTVQSLTLWY